MNCCCENLWLRKEVLERHQLKYFGIFMPGSGHSELLGVWAVVFAVSISENVLGAGCNSPWHPSTTTFCMLGGIWWNDLSSAHRWSCPARGVEEVEITCTKIWVHFCHISKQTLVSIVWWSSWRLRKDEARGILQLETSDVTWLVRVFHNLTKRKEKSQEQKKVEANSSKAFKVHFFSMPFWKVPSGSPWGLSLAVL